MQFTFDEIWASMGFLARAVTAVLLLMAIASLGVFFERVVVFARANVRSRRFAAESAPVMAARRHAEVLRLCSTHAGTPLAELVAHGLSTHDTAEGERRAGRGKLAPAELTRRALDRKLDSLSSDLRRGFSALASVGSVAPFVGLFGTVVGIINAFEGIARTGSGGLGSVSAGIAEALVVTAFGLAVAIPAVLAFNFLTTRADRLDLALQNAAGELCDHLENGADDGTQTGA